MTTNTPTVNITSPAWSRRRLWWWVLWSIYSFNNFSTAITLVTNWLACASLERKWEYSTWYKLHIKIYCHLELADQRSHMHFKEATCTVRKQDPALLENRALNKCEVCFNWVYILQLIILRVLGQSRIHEVQLYDTDSILTYSAQSRHIQICW